MNAIHPTTKAVGFLSNLFLIRLSFRYTNICSLINKILPLICLLCQEIIFLIEVNLFISLTPIPPYPSPFIDTPPNYRNQHIKFIRRSTKYIHNNLYLYQKNCC